MQKMNDPRSFDLGPYKINNPDELTRNIVKAWEEGSRLMARFIERSDKSVSASPFSPGGEMMDMSKTFQALWQQWLAEPHKLVEAQGDLMRSYMEL
ncbi:MAG TPA: hypothetical protein PK264_18540, partial [Hyphomicrobiaceae bacterium]|nr:hypothetical protein [Hyphomicrobiaceae bacterium]